MCIGCLWGYWVVAQRGISLGATPVGCARPVCGKLCPQGLGGRGGRVGGHAGPAPLPLALPCSQYTQSTAVSWMLLRHRYTHALQLCPHRCTVTAATAHVKRPLCAGNGPQIATSPPAFRPAAGASGTVGRLCRQQAERGGEAGEAVGAVGARGGYREHKRRPGGALVPVRDADVALSATGCRTVVFNCALGV